MVKARREIITFKVESGLLAAMKGIDNRSEFIRSAVLTALKNVCPLCRGSGTLSPRQREHWEEFARSHPVVECQDCHELRLVCRTDRKGPAKGKR